MKQVIVGTYESGYERIQLLLEKGTGGWGQLLNKETDIAKLVIGADCKWAEVHEVLLHEVFEHTANRLLCRYKASQDLSRDCGSFIFLMTHSQFTDCCVKASEFMVNCLPDLEKAWKAWHKKPKPKKKKRRKKKK